MINSATRFGEISPLWQKLKVPRQFLVCFNYSVWQTFALTLTKSMQQVKFTLFVNGSDVNIKL